MAIEISLFYPLSYHFFYHPLIKKCQLKMLIWSLQRILRLRAWSWIGISETR
jgi:hypothetical protein